MTKKTKVSQLQHLDPKDGFHHIWSQITSGSPSQTPAIKHTSANYNIKKISFNHLSFVAKGFWFCWNWKRGCRSCFSQEGRGARDWWWVDWLVKWWLCLEINLFFGEKERGFLAVGQDVVVKLRPNADYVFVFFSSETTCSCRAEVWSR